MRATFLAAWAAILVILPSCEADDQIDVFPGTIEFDRSEHGDALLRLRWQNTTTRPVCFDEAYVRGGGVADWVRLSDAQNERDIEYIGPVDRFSSWPPGNATLIPPSGRLSIAANLTTNFNLSAGRYDVEVEVPGIYCDDVRFPQSQADAENENSFAQRIVVKASSEGAVARLFQD